MYEYIDVALLLTTEHSIMHATAGKQWAAVRNVNQCEKQWRKPAMERQFVQIYVTETIGNRILYITAFKFLASCLQLIVCYFFVSCV